MKGARDQQNKQSKQGFTKKPRPEIRDDMDSRENKEGNYRSGNNKQGVKSNTKKRNS